MATAGPDPAPLFLNIPKLCCGHLWSFIVTSVVNSSRNIPLLLMFLRYRVHVTCCMYIHFCNFAHCLLLSSVTPAVGNSLDWALSHSPSLPCLYLTPLRTTLRSFLFWSRLTDVFWSFAHAVAVPSSRIPAAEDLPRRSFQPGTGALSRHPIWIVLTGDPDVHCPCAVAPGTCRAVRRRWVTLGVLWWQVLSPCP